MPAVTIGVLPEELQLSPLPDPAGVPRPWCNAYPPGVPPRYEYPPVPVTRFLDDAARDFPVGTALRFRTRSWTWSDLRDLVDRAAARLADLGVVAGDRVALVAPSTPAAVVASFATWRLGAVLVPLDPSLPTDELRDRLLRVEPSVAVVDVVALDAVAAVRPRLPGLRHVVATDPLRWLGGADRVLAPVRALLQRRRQVRPDDDVLRFDDLLEGGPALVRQTATTPSTPAAVLFTSGTVGDGRGVVLTHGNLVANAFQTRLWVPDVRSGHEVVLGALPLWHAYGLTAVLLLGALAGATIVLVPRPDPESVLDAAESSRATLFPGVPRLYEALATHPSTPKRDLSSLRVAVSGGAPLEPATIAAFERVVEGVRLRQGYGQTETGPLTHAAPVYGPVDVGAVGLPVTDTIAIVRRLDAPDEEAPDGEIGELLVHGPQVMAGYWRGAEDGPDATGPWHATGDLASVGEDGVFRVHGRVRDLVERDGVRIVPALVEDALRRYPGVRTAVVVGVGDPDDVAGTAGPSGGSGDGTADGDGGAIRGVPAAELVAVAVPRPGVRLVAEQLLAHLEQELDEELVPDRVVVRDGVPESGFGKVLRRTLRVELAASPTVAARADGDAATIEEVAG